MRWGFLCGLGLAVPLALPCVGARAQDAGETWDRRSSVTRPADREAELVPVAAVLHAAIDENSAIVSHQDWFLTLNDSGGEPVLYADRTPTFENAAVLAVRGAANSDWEAMTVVGDRVFVCDVGDNARARADLTVYATRFTKPKGPDQPPSLTVDAVYPIAYPDGAHDCEAAFEKDGKLHLIVKNRGEPTTDIFRFEELKTSAELGADRRNVAVKAGSLNVPDGEQVTDAALHAGKGLLAVLTYGQLRFHRLDDLTGDPVKTILLYARQCEALTFRGEDLIVTNEQRDVFRLPNAADLPVDRLFPARPKLTTPRIPEAKAGLVDGLPEKATPLADLRLRQAANDDEVRMGIVGDRLLLDGYVVATADRRTTNQNSARLGSSLVFVFPRDRGLRLRDDDLQVALVVREDDTVTPLRIWTGDPRRRPELMPDARAFGSHQLGRVQFRLSLPLAKVLPEGVTDRFRMNLVSLVLRKDAAPLTLSGDSIWAVLRPGMAADVTITAAEPPAKDGGEKDE